MSRRDTPRRSSPSSHCGRVDPRAIYAPASRQSSIFLGRIVGVVFMRINSKVRPAFALVTMKASTDLSAEATKWRRWKRVARRRTSTRASAGEPPGAPTIRFCARSGCFAFAPVTVRRRSGLGTAHVKTRPRHHGSVGGIRARVRFRRARSPRRTLSRHLGRGQVVVAGRREPHETHASAQATTDR
jgi:hypothetical protein